MLGAIFRRAQDTVDTAVGLAFSRVLIATPFLIAAAFAVSALSVRLNREFDAEIANLMLAGLFVVVGVITAGIVSLRNNSVAAGTSAPALEQQAPLTSDAAAGPSAAIDGLSFSPEDRELLLAALTTTAPIALPAMFRVMWRNLPLLLTLGAALFMVFRTLQTTAGTEQPAESRADDSAPAAPRQAA